MFHLAEYVYNYATDLRVALKHGNDVICVASRLSLCECPDLILADMDRPAGSSEPALIRLPEESRSIDLSKSTDERLREF